MGEFYSGSHVRRENTWKSRHITPRSGKKPDGQGMKRMMGIMGGCDEKVQEKIMSDPKSFIIPRASGKNAAMDGKKGEEGHMTLMRMQDRFGEQEMTVDMKKRKKSFTVTARRPDEQGELREDMRNFHRKRAQKQRRTGGADLFLADGNRKGAASVETGQNRKWTESRMKDSLGDERSSMLERICPYADDTKEREKLSIVREQLDTVRSQCRALQSKSAGGDSESYRELEKLRMVESRLQRRIDELTQVLRKKEQLRRVTLQKINYSEDMMRNGRILAGIRGRRSLSGDTAVMGQHEQDINVENNGPMGDIIDRGEDQHLEVIGGGTAG